MPTLYADLLCTVDGLQGVPRRPRGPAPRAGLAARDWRGAELADVRASTPTARRAGRATVDGFAFDYALAARLRLGQALGRVRADVRALRRHRRVARLPGPPYHFMSRVTRVDGADRRHAGRQRRVEVEYDVPADAWYFDQNARRTMPFAGAAGGGAPALRLARVLRRQRAHDRGGLVLPQPRRHGHAAIAEVDARHRPVSVTTPSSTSRSRPGMIIGASRSPVRAGERAASTADDGLRLLPPRRVRDQAGLPIPPRAPRARRRAAADSSRPATAPPRYFAAAAASAAPMLCDARPRHRLLARGQGAGSAARAREGLSARRVVLQGALLPGPRAARLAGHRGDVAGAAGALLEHGLGAGSSRRASSRIATGVADDVEVPRPGRSDATTWWWSTSRSRRDAEADGATLRGRTRLAVGRRQAHLRSAGAGGADRGRLRHDGRRPGRSVVATGRDARADTPQRASSSASITFSMNSSSLPSKQRRQSGRHPELGIQFHGCTAASR